MAAGSYQVVSEHSILSARNDTQKQKKMEFGTEDIQLCVPEWKERFEEIERHWKKRRKPEEKRCRTRRHHAPTRRSGRRDKILKKMEEILVDLRSSISDLRKKSEGEKEAGETGRETDVFDKETRSEGKPELVTMEEQREGDSPKETTPTESSPNLPENAAVKVEMMRTVCDEEMFPSPWNKRLDGSGREETPEDSPSEARPEDSPSVAPCLGRTTMEVPPRSVAEEQGLNLVYDGYDRSGLEKNARVEWNVGEVELDISLGQAQASISKAALIIKSTQVFSKPSQSNNGERVQEWVGPDWTLLKMGHVFNSGSQAQTINITLFVHEGGFPLKKEVQKIMGLFLQALHVIFPTTEQHHIRIFNVPPQSCLVTSLFDDHLSPTYANKRLEKLSPTNLRLIVKDENGRSHDLQLLFKALVGAGGHYDNGSIQLTNISFMDKPPLVHSWGLGGLKKYGWDPGGNQRDESKQNTSAMEYHGSQTQQYHKWYHQVHDNLMDECAICMVLVNSSVEEVKAPLDPIQDHEGGVTSQEGIPINYDIKGESEFLKRTIDLRHEWLMWLKGFVGNLTRTLENKSQEFDNNEEENISVFIKFGWQNRPLVEHLIQGIEFSRMSSAEIHHKQWDPGEPYSASCIIRTLSFKLWDPGGRLVTVCFRYLHLEDKMNFEGAGIDTNAVSEGQDRKFQNKYEWRKWRSITWGPLAHKHTPQFDVTELPTWQWGGRVRNISLIWRESVIYSWLAIHSVLGWNWDWFWGRD